MIISTTNLNEARKQILKAKPPITVKAQSLEFNRKILEYGKFDILLALDKPLNHVMAKIAAKNKVAIGLDLSQMQNLDKKEKALALSRIIQNIKTLRRAKTKITLINYKDKKDAQDFLLSLGASTQQTKETTK